VLVLPDIHDEIVASLLDAGYESAEMVAAASIEALMEVPGIDQGTAESVLAAAQAEIEAAAARAQEAAVEVEAPGDAGAVEEAEAAVAEGGTDEAGDPPAADDEGAKRE
jgi:Holliday junction resolvasome RuvABC DNA-binding subunit